MSEAYGSGSIVYLAPSILGMGTIHFLLFFIPIPCFAQPHEGQMDQP